MAEFPSDIYLSSLTTEDGFIVRGLAAGDNLGQGVAAIGDLNGDGIDDFMVGAFYADANGTNSGAAYVVFGTTAGFPLTLDLNSLDGTNGFRLAGPSGTVLGYGGAGADVNGDGFGDLIVSAPLMGGSNRGGAYVIYGHDGPFDAAINLGEPVQGVSSRILNPTSNQLMGIWSNGVGDMNGDGLGDFALATDRGGGAVYVVFGDADGLPLDFNLAQIDGTNGFKVAASLSVWQVGRSVSTAGDLNGDGKDDLIVGAPGYDVINGDDTGAAFVIYGQSSFAATVDVSSLDGTAGFKIFGEQAGNRFGFSVASAGDFDGDGHDDLIIGAQGKAFLVFGEATGPSEINFGAGAGSHWVMRLDYPANTAFLNVDGGFDFNGDGRSDILVGGSGLDNNYGALYVVFGGAREPSLRLDQAAAANGVTIHGASFANNLTATIGELGDINGDGIEDFFIGAKGDDVNGANAGAGYVIYGRAEARDFTGGSGDETAVGGLGADTMVGGAGKDNLSGLRGADILDGGDGNDLLSGGGEADQLSGGLGGDILQGDDGDDTLDGGEGGDKLFGGLGADDMIGGLGNDRFDGGADVDTATGGEGNDYLDGGAGADSMAGGLGNDVYLVDHAGDSVVEAVGEGFDIVRTELDGWVLGANFEGLELQGGGDIGGSGNSATNNLQGNSGANRLDGGAGVDTINGNDGDDIVIGGLGNDLLRGGTGADVFRVSHAFAASLETDQVYDFSTAEGDIVDLSDAFGGTIAVVSAFSKQAGQLVLTFAGGVTTLKLDVTGDGKVDYQMKVNGDVTGDSEGWLL